MSAKDIETLDENEAKTPLARNIILLMKHYVLSQSAFAVIAGVSQPTISHIIHDAPYENWAPTQSTLQSIADGYGVTVEWLLENGHTQNNLAGFTLTLVRLQFFAQSTPC